jgi:type IV secretory pathway TraG/TraD family ATPase VirD4
VFLFAVLVLLASIVGVYKYILTAAERMYLPTYAESIWKSFPVDGVSVYNVPAVFDQREYWRFAVDGEIRQNSLPDGQVYYAVTPLGRSHGIVRLGAMRLRIDDKMLREQLVQEVYAQPLLHYFWLPLFATGLTLIIGLIIAVPRDKARLELRRRGRIISGPQLVSSKEFNRRIAGDGVHFGEVRKSGFGKKMPQVRIAREAEREHFLIIADTGQGKSVLFKEILSQVRERGEAAVIYDPSREFIASFYNEQSDVILNPSDMRMPWWNPAQEIERESEAMMVATCMFPFQNERNRYFVDATRDIFVHLLKKGITPEELYHIMSTEGEIDKHVAGTWMAPSISPQAGSQRGGVISSFNMAARALGELPRQNECARTWSVLDWSKHRKGWIFLTSKATEEDLIQPLITFWIELLMQRLLNEGYTEKSPVWFCLDEAADLKIVPHMHKFLTQARKCNCPTVLGFQGRDQVDEFYGKLGKTILSQPHTRIYMKTSEPEAAKWISDSLGEVLVERLRESVSTGPDGTITRTETIDPPHREPLIPYSEITGLKKFHGYLKYNNLVVPLKTKHVKYPARAEKYVARAERPSVSKVEPPSVESSACHSIEPITFFE